MKPLAMLLLWCPLQAETVTYAQQIGPVLLERCASCHRPGEAAPFPLLTYEDARQHAAQIVRVTELRFMPPWLPIPGHGDFAGAVPELDRIPLNAGVAMVLEKGEVGLTHAVKRMGPEDRVTDECIGFTRCVTADLACTVPGPES